MTYKVWNEAPGEADQIEHMLYTVSNGGTVYCNECASCSECYRNRSIYRACPTCRERIDWYGAWPHVCRCGTALCTCVTNGIHVVFAYAKPNEAFEPSKDDTI